MTERIAFTHSGRHIVLNRGEGHITSEARDDTIHFTYDTENGKVLNIKTSGAKLNDTINRAIAGAVRRHLRAKKLAAEVNAYED